MPHVSHRKGDNDMSTQTVMSMDEARATLRGSKLRCTSCRLAVLRHLSTATSPLSHSELAEQLVPRGYDKSTIYRSLVEMSERFRLFLEMARQR